MGRKNFVRDMVQVGLFVAVIAVCAQISVPLAGGVPFTLQTFAIALTGLILGWKKGLVTVLIYILVGAVGVPVFAQFMGGLGVLFGPTGGFILAFPLLSLAAGLAGRKNNPLVWAVVITVATGFMLFIGGVFFAIYQNTTLAHALTVTVSPFIISSIIQIGLVVAAGKVLRHAIVKSGISI
ncbi:MAG: biotin transporter BioY [Defluviitaleaceae bacterium]|nr:biotin transporter BioY [Defluviitaleaceae bacterium]